MTFGDKLKYLRSRNNWTQEELAQKLGTSKQVISRYEANQRAPKITVVQAYADALGVPRGYLIDDSIDISIEGDLYPFTIPNAMRIGRRSLPMLGSVSCGVPKYAEEDFEFYVNVGAEVKADFVLRANGDSMTGARIFDGDLVFVRSQSDVNDGQIAVVLIDDETLLKRVYKLPDGRCQLRAENPKYPPIMVGGKAEMRDVRILGLAVAVQTDVI